MIPLVLVHGFMGGSAQWAAQVGALSQGRDVIAFDLPGFGKNAHLPVIDTIEGFGEWVIAQLRKAGIERYDLLGHSMGGMIVQEIARREQDRIEHLILYGTGALGVLPGRFETIAQSKERAVRDGAKASARRISATWFLQTEAAQGYMACAEIAQCSAPAALPAGLDAMQAWSGEDFLTRIIPKTLIVWGDNDRTYSWDQTQLLWRSIKGANLAVLPGCAHAAHAEKPMLFNAIISDFLNT